MNSTGSRAFGRQYGRRFDWLLGRVRRALLFRQLVQELVEFLLRQPLGSVRVLPLFGAQGGQLRRRCHNMRGQEYDELSLGITQLRSPEQISQQRDIAQKGYLGDGFPVGRNGDVIRRTHVNDRGIDSARAIRIGGNGKGEGRVDLRDLRRHYHLHQSILRDERGDLQNDANTRIGDRIMGVAETVIGDTGDQGDRLTNGNGGRLVIAGEDGGPRQYFRLARLRNGVEGHGVILTEDLIETVGSAEG